VIGYNTPDLETVLFINLINLSVQYLACLRLEICEGFWPLEIAFTMSKWTLISEIPSEVKPFHSLTWLVGTQTQISSLYSHLKSINSISFAKI
jgi:hypothetical protein